MKTLVELYGSSVTHRDPVITDIMFITAFPVNTEQHASTMQKANEQLTVPYLEKWQARLAKDISDKLDQDKTPQEIVTDVPWMTQDEFKELLSIIDTYVSGDAQAVFALRIVELTSYLDALKSNALQLLKAMVREKLERSKILTPFSNPDGAPKILDASGQTFKG